MPRWLAVERADPSVLAQSSVVRSSRSTLAPPLDNPAPSANCPAVFRLTKLSALLLVALWLPATLHCQLENAGFDLFFACADQAAHTKGAACSGDACQVLESGQIALSKSRIDFAALPLLACACVSCFQHLVLPAPAPEIFAVRQDETLPLQRTWQFARHAALPARAPSLVG